MGQLPAPFPGRSRFPSRAPAYGHLVGRLSLVVDVPPAQGNHAFTERLSTLIGTRLLPVVERVFDERDCAGEVVRIDRLDLDLGHVALADLPRRLADRLNVALAAAIDGRGLDYYASDPSRPVATRVAIAAAGLEAFEHYLRHGAWPAYCGLAQSTTPGSCLDDLLVKTPTALAALLRRLGDDAAIVARLVHQTAEGQRTALLELLEPAHARRVVRYLDEIRASHRAAPIVPATPPELDTLVWTITLRDALHVAGLQANRKAFLRRLLQQLAGSLGLPVATLWFQLRRSAELAAAAGRAPTSLVATLAEITRDPPPAMTGDAAIAEITAILEGAAGSRTSDLAALLDRATATRAPALQALLRGYRVRDPAGLARLGLPIAAMRMASGDAALRADAAAAARSAPLNLLVRQLSAAAACDDRERTLLARLIGAHDPTTLTSMVLDRALTALARHRGVSPARFLHDLRLVLTAEGSQSGRPGRHSALAAALTPVMLDHAALDGVQTMLSAATRLPSRMRADAVESLLPRLLRLPRHVLANRATIDLDPRVLAALSIATLRRLGSVLRPNAGIDWRGAGRSVLMQAFVGGAAAPRMALDTQQQGDVRATFARIGPEAGAAILDLLVPRSAGSTEARIATLLATGDLSYRPARAGGEALLLALLQARLGRGFSRSPRARNWFARLSADARARLVEALAPATGSGATFLQFVERDAADDAAPLSRALRHDPFDTLRRQAARATSLGDRHASILATPDAFALAIASLDRDDRERTVMLGHLLAARWGAPVIPLEKLARALAEAIRNHRRVLGARDFAHSWMSAVLAVASPAERASVRALIRANPRLADVPPATNSTAVLQARAVLARASASGREALLRMVRRASVRDRLATDLAERELVNLIVKIAPVRGHELLRAGERVAAVRQAAGAPIPRAAFWADVLDCARRDTDSIRSLVACLLDGIGASPPPPVAARAAVERGLLRSPDRAAEAALRAEVERRTGRRTHLRATEPAIPAIPSGALLVENAGLVLVSAYLPRLFGALDYLVPDANGRSGWRSPLVQERAVHVLQSLVDDGFEACEPQLTLAKLLCGMDLATPVVDRIVPTAHEIEMNAQLLRTVKAGWPPLNNSSIDALRETFLQRPGQLRHGPDGWRLDVERKVIDILLEQLPWGYSTIRHPWMSETLSTHWR